MRYSLILPCLLFAILASSQNIRSGRESNETQTITLRANFDFENNQVISESPGSLDHLDRIQITLAAGDVRIDYDLKPKLKGVFGVQIDSIVDKYGAVFPLKPENIYGDYGPVITYTKGLKKRITIANTVDNANLKWLSGLSRIYLKVSFHPHEDGFYDCEGDEPPNLTFGDYAPEVIFGGIGAATFVIGLIVDDRSDEIYTDYEGQNRKEIADPIFEKANKKHQDAFITKGVGLALMAGSAVFALSRHLRRKKEKKEYRIFCRDYSLQPYFKLDQTPASTGGQLGLAFTLSF